MKIHTPTFWRRVQRRLIRTNGPASWFGRSFSWRLNCGLRVSIDDPAEFIQTQLLEHGVYEPAISELIECVLQQGDLFVDIGANIGCHTLSAASHGANVYSFEPAPHLRRRLLKNVAINRLSDVVSVYPQALGAETGEATLYLADRDDDGSHSLIAGISARSVEPVQVPITTLDTHFADDRDRPPTLLKIDVEGYEARVLDGALNLLESENKPALIIETGDEMAAKLNESAASVLDRLFSRGYQVFRIGRKTGLVALKKRDIDGELRNYFGVHHRHPNFTDIENRIDALRNVAASSTS